MISLDAKEKVVDTNELKIYQNTLIYSDSVIQLDNISRISVAPMEKMKVPTWAVVCILVGFIMMGFNGLIGFLILAAGIGMCGYILYFNSQLGHYLTIELNSGRLIYFSGKDAGFLKRIMKVLAECINSSQENYVVNMGNAQIEKVQFGDNNQMR